MLKRNLLVAAIFALLSIAPAQARSHHHRHHHGRLPWCGIYMTQVTGIHDRRLWLAINWAHVGTDAGGPGIGVIVVWRHHVGRIVGRDERGQWVVNSGNDGGRVRTRPRNLARVVAFRRI